jgi:hypothetical protein
VCLIGDVSTGWINSAGRLFFCGLNLGVNEVLHWNMVVRYFENVASAPIISSPTVLKGKSGCGCLRTSAISVAAIPNLPVEESCGIGEL